MRHLVSTSMFISFVVAGSISILCIFATVRWPDREDAPVIGLAGSMWVVAVNAYMICKGKRYEKKVKEYRQRARKEIIRLLDEEGPMSKEELESHPKYRAEYPEGYPEGIWRYVGQYEWCVERSYYPYDTKEFVLDKDPMDNLAPVEIMWDDLEFHIKHLLSDRLFEETIDGKYQRYQQTVKAFKNECCVQGETERGELYNAYVAYCKEKGITPVSFLFFDDEILDMTQRTTPSDGKGKTYYLLGIKRN